MRIFHTLLWAILALACAAPNCDTHDSWESVGSASGSSATSPASTGSAKQHEDVVHAMESVTGAKLAAPKSKKPKTVHTSDDSGGGNYGRSQKPSPPPPPPPPELPDRGRKIGERCDDHWQCASDYCDFDHCRLKTGGKLTKGEKCTYETDCASDRCYMDECQ